MGTLSDDDLTETERLVQMQRAAAGSTPSLYQKFIAVSERDAIKERMKPEDDPAGSVGGSQDELTDAIPDKSETPEETAEGFSNGYGDSSHDNEHRSFPDMRQVIIGLAHIGVKYGPGIMSALHRSAIWTFSRIGLVFHNAAKLTTEHIEKANNSTTKLSKRLEAARASIVKSLNDGKTLDKTPYSNSSVISYLKVGSDLHVSQNLKIFASDVRKLCNSLFTDATNGQKLVKKLADSKVGLKDLEIGTVMKVQPSTSVFTKGAPKGFKVPEPEQHVGIYRSSSLWPGDACAVFLNPLTEGMWLAVIRKAYANAQISVYVDISASQKGASSITGLTGAELIAICKSTELVLESIKAMAKQQAEFLKADSSLSESIKHLFYSLADQDAKEELDESLGTPIYLKSRFCSETVMNGTSDIMTHTSRVTAAAVKLLEDCARRLEKS